jgi:hypothetical protein
MFENMRQPHVKATCIKRTVTRQYDDKGNVVKEQVILEDGGVGQEEAEKRLEKTNKAFARMDKMFQEMDGIFKDLFD